MKALKRQVFPLNSVGARWARISVIRYSDDMHILHIWYNDVSWSDICGARLGSNVFVYVNTVSCVFPVHVCYARLDNSPRRCSSPFCISLNLLKLQNHPDGY